MAKAATDKMSTIKKRYLILTGIVCMFFIAFSFTINNFASVMTLTNLIRQSAVFTILSVGMMQVIIVGGIDLSVGANIALSGAAAALALNAVGPESAAGALAGFAVAVLVSSVIGIINGFLTGYLGISAFIATLAMQIFCKGITLLITNSQRIVVSNHYFKWLGNEQWKFGSVVIPTVVVVLIPVIVFSIWALKNLKYGIKMYAVGGNARAAHATGINSRKVILSTYAITGFLCGLATIITIGRVSSAQPLAGEGMEFTVITAVVVGGTSLLGGVGTAGGTFLGCLLMGIITLGVNMIDISIFWNYIIKGACVLLAVTADQIISSPEKYTLKKKEVLIDSNGAHHAVKELKVGKQHTLELNHISKSFSSVPALQDISVRFESGKVHALMGENGAGKSTLIKILSGVYTKDEGTITIDGTPVEIRSTRDSEKLGISVIYQEFSLVPELSVAQNAFLGKEKKKGKIFLEVSEMAKRAEEYMAKLNLKLNVNRKVRSLSVSQQQMVEIAKAMSADSWLVVMDEPTSAITDADKEKLFTVIREMKAAGMAIVYVSHRMQEIFEICDDVTVLRDGHYITTLPVSETSEQELTRLMVGREVNDIFTREKTEIDRSRKPVLKIDNFGRKGVFAPINLEVYAGEVLGLSGLMGAGRTEIVRCIYGLDKNDTGTIELNGEKVTINSPRDALEKGICYVSEDRRWEGIIPLRSIKENISLANLQQVCNGSIVDEKKMNDLYEDYHDKLNIKAASRDLAISRLSGGNQQKCCLARMLACNPTLLILDEPTRGIDVGAKKEIHQLIDQMVKANIAVILISSELQEILGASDRIVVLSEGRKSGEFEAKEATEESIMQRAFAAKSDSGVA